MVKTILATCCMVFLVSCRCQRTGDTETETPTEPISSERIREFLRERNFDIIHSANSAVAFNITKKLLEGTTDEYSNKLVLKDTLNPRQIEELRTLLQDDASYDWSEKEQETEFDPELQFLLRNGTKRITLKVDRKSQRLGFINLEGQKVIALSGRLADYFEKLP